MYIIVLIIIIIPFVALEWYPWSRNRAKMMVSSEIITQLENMAQLRVGI